MTFQEDDLLNSFLLKLFHLKIKKIFEPVTMDETRSKEIGCSDNIQNFKGISKEGLNSLHVKETGVQSGILKICNKNQDFLIKITFIA